MQKASEASKRGNYVQWKKHLAVVLPNSVQKLSLIAKGMPSSQPREVPAAKRLSAALDARCATSRCISLKHPFNDALAESIELAVSARLVISEDRKRVARAFNDIGWRNAVMK